MQRIDAKLLALLVAGVLIHAALMGLLHVRSGSVDANAFRSLDSREYYTIARNVVRHGAFSQSEGPPLQPDTWRTPGYPLFLGAIMLVFGDGVIPLIVAQQLLSIANVLLLFIIARSTIGDRRAMIASTLFLLEPYHLYYSTWLMATTLLTTVLLLTWFAWRVALKSDRWVLPASCGALAALAVLVRPVAILVPIALVAGFLLRCERKHGALGVRIDVRRCVRLALPCAVAAIIVTGGWMFRNFQVVHTFALSDQAGIVLAYFKATEVVLWREGRTADRYLETSLSPDHADTPHVVWESIDRRLRESLAALPDVAVEELSWRNLAQGNKTSAESFAVSSALGKIARSELLATPLSTLSCCVVRCAALLTFPLNMAIRAPNGVTVSRPRSLVIGAVYTALTLAVVVGVIRSRAAWSDLFFPMVCVVALLIATTPQLDPRFRVPMIPFLVFMSLLPKRNPQSEPMPRPRETSPIS